MYKNIEDIKFPSNPSTANEAVEDILAFAVTNNASDVHCDPRLTDIVVKLRTDGMIREVGTLPKRIADEFISRLKILSGARTDIHAIPQDGRFQTHVNATAYNIRISFMPTYYGENAVMRILSAQSTNHASYASLGFTPDHVYAISEALKKTSGLILVTGPTGSGKTTTLHTCLMSKRRDPLSIVTLEDPVEYEIAGVRQIHIRHTHGVTFASGLRSVLRQDPDVIMVGEIRDNETARVAVHTALTGHLVLSTLHTNSALETIPRLLDMGVDHYLLAATLRLIVAQRLLRTVCQDCNMVGCDLCNQTGYHGRTIIAEVCLVDEKMQKLIAEKRPLSEITAYAKSHGFRFMYNDGLEKVDWGITSREEIARVLST
ncbi:MAG: GspE/PulE family protein [Candidatus Taylorbacteria bacterium]